MNKELEALQKLRDLVEYLTRIDYVPTDLRNEVKELLIKHYEDSDGHFSQIEKALNELEDAKHNYRAVKEMYNNSVAYSTKIQKELNELKKRNEPVRLLTYNIYYGMVEAKSAKDYNYDEWYCAMGYCPICGEQNPIGNRYCGQCGNKLDNDWSREK